MAKAAKFDLGIAVGVGVMPFDLELALVVKKATEYERSITIGALNRQVVERGKLSATKV